VSPQRDVARNCGTRRPAARLRVKPPARGAGTELAPGVPHDQTEQRLAEHRREAVRRLCERTEGWPAPLRLVTQSLRIRPGAVGGRFFDGLASRTPATWTAPRAASSRAWRSGSARSAATATGRGLRRPTSARSATSKASSAWRASSRGWVFGSRPERHRRSFARVLPGHGAAPRGARRHDARSPSSTRGRARGGAASRSPGGGHAPRGGPALPRRRNVELAARRLAAEPEGPAPAEWRQAWEMRSIARARVLGRAGTRRRGAPAPRPASSRTRCATAGDVSSSACALDRARRERGGRC